MSAVTSRRVLLAAAAGTMTTAVAPGSPVADAAPRSRWRPFIPQTFTDPYAAAASTSSGRYIRSLAFDRRGRLYPGHGDWAANIGPIDVHYLDPRTGTFSDSLLSMPTESTEYLRSVNGRILVPNADPKTYWEGGQPLALQRADGSFTMSSWSNTVHCYDVVPLGRRYGRRAYAAVGSYIDAKRGAAANAVYFTTDDGRTFRTAHYPSDTLQSAYPGVCLWIGGKLYVSAQYSLWRWKGTVPPKDGRWQEYFTEVEPEIGLTYHPSSGQFAASNGRVAVMITVKDRELHAYAFNGRQMWKVLDGHRYQAGITSSGGFIYTMTSKGLLCTRDGRRWWIHEHTTDLDAQYYSLAIDTSSVWGGTQEATISAFASRWGPWRKLND
ncbi:MAG: hypothetical protein ACK5LN_13865 [Propioniciclava sp.]